MKNFMIYLVAVLSLNSRTEKQSIIGNCEPIELKDNLISLDAGKGLKHRYILGVSDKNSRIFKDTLSSPSEKKDCSVRKSLVNNIFDEVARCFMVMDADICSSLSSGIIGNEFFKGNGIYHFDFDNLKLCKLSRQDLKSVLDDENYSEIKSSFKNHYLEIVVSINWTDYRFRFDTSGKEMFSMPSHKKISFEKEHFIRCNKIYKEDLSLAHEILIYPFTKIYINDTGYSASVHVGDDVDYNSVGMGFLKGFNWVIDYENNKVYYKKNLLSLDDPFISGYSTSIIGSKIIIDQAPKTALDFKVGDEISSVNEVSLSSDNICEMQSVLENTSDFKSLKIVVSR